MCNARGSHIFLNDFDAHREISPEIPRVQSSRLSAERNPGAHGETNYGTDRHIAHVCMIAENVSVEQLLAVDSEKLHAGATRDAFALFMPHGCKTKLTMISWAMLSLSSTSFSR